MNILAVETALGACSVAVLADGLTLAHEHLTLQRGHAEALAPMVEKMMRAARIEYSALDRVAVTTGPGTFTGQRVGLAFARALGVALKKPVIGITTLDVMAEEALANDSLSHWCISVSDAKRGEAYLGARSATGEILIAPELIALESIAAKVAYGTAQFGSAVLLSGTAAPLILPLLQAVGMNPVDSLVRQPDAIFVARLAQNVSPGPPPKPLYLRAPDAKLPGSPA